MNLGRWRISKRVHLVNSSVLLFLKGAAVSAQPVASPVKTPAHKGRIIVSPLAKKLAAERGIDLLQVKGEQHLFRGLVSHRLKWFNFLLGKKIFLVRLIRYRARGTDHKEGH